MLFLKARTYSPPVFPFLVHLVTAGFDVYFIGTRTLSPLSCSDNQTFPFLVKLHLTLLTVCLLFFSLSSPHLSSAHMKAHMKSFCGLLTVSKPWEQTPAACSFIPFLLFLVCVFKLIWHLTCLLCSSLWMVVLFCLWTVSTPLKALMLRYCAHAFF